MDLSLYFVPVATVVKLCITGEELVKNPRGSIVLAMAISIFASVGCDVAPIASHLVARSGSKNELNFVATRTGEYELMVSVENKDGKAVRRASKKLLELQRDTSWVPFRSGEMSVLVKGVSPEPSVFVVTFMDGRSMELTLASGDKQALVHDDGTFRTIMYILECYSVQGDRT